MCLDREVERSGLGLLSRPEDLLEEGEEEEIEVEVQHRDKEKENGEGVECKREGNRVDE